MNLFENFKNRLSTSLKFVAFLSILFQLWFLIFLVFKIFYDVLFLFAIPFYLFIIAIGFSRYIEIKSTSFKEKVINFILLLNCFPFLFGIISLVAFFAMSNSESETVSIKPEEVKFIIVDENGNKVEKRGNEVRIDVNSVKNKDSVVKFIIDK